jgi:endonuclease YncB( thermonuclease family)
MVIRRRNAQQMQPDAGFRWPVSPNILGGAALALALIVFIGPMLNSESTLTPAKFVPAVTVSREAPRASAVETGAISKDPSIITGRATAIQGDVLRIDGRLIKLSGIEPPGPAQHCPTRTGKSWNCGACAKARHDGTADRRLRALRRGQNSTVLASCTVRDIDLAGELVSNGVCSRRGLSRELRLIEAVAAAGLGVWRDANAHGWRAEVWEEAKRAAPDGCPIKGQASDASMRCRGRRVRQPQNAHGPR